MDFLGMKLAMDIDFILTFVSQANSDGSSEHCS
jgi:hypothetical protein